MDQSDQFWVFEKPIAEKATNSVVHFLNLVVLRTRDLERSRGFYESLGLRFQLFEYGNGAYSMSGPVPPKAPITMKIEQEEVMVPQTFLEISTVDSSETIPHQQIGFFVASVEKAVEAAIAAGGTLLKGPAKWPYGMRAAVADPDGHRVELTEDPWGRLTGEYP